MTTLPPSPPAPPASDVCRSCGSPGVEEFCGACGQKRVLGDRSLVPWALGVFDEVFSLDGKTLRTMRLLVTSPGELTTAWIRGERARFTPPIRLYLAASVLFFASLSILGTSPIPLLDLFGAGESLLQEEDIRAIAAADPGELPPDVLRAAADTYRALIEDVVTIGLVIVVPATALILHLLLLRARQWYYVDHVVHALHVISVALLTWTVAWPLFFVDVPLLRRVLAPTVWIVLLIYGAASFARVYGLGIVKTAIAYPAMLVLGAAGALGVAITFGEARTASRLLAASELWEEAFARYGERLYVAAVAPGRPADSQESLNDLAEVVYARAPRELQRFDPHFMTDFGDLRLQRGDAVGALRIFSAARAGPGREPDAVGGAAMANMQLGELQTARELSTEFLAMLDGGALGFHPERTNRYRRGALEALDGGAAPR